MQKEADAFRTISEVADELALPQHVLRFWEMRFPQIKPMKRSGGRRYYRSDDVDLIRGIKRLLYSDGYTIKGVQRILKEQGPRAVAGVGRGDPPPGPEEVEREPAGTSEARDSAPALELEPEAPGEALAPGQTRILRAALAEIEECLQALEAARESA